MRPLRYLLIMLAALMLLAPAALAAGPSAGDQQYTDPLGGSNGSKGGSSSSGSKSPSTTPAPTPAPSSSATPGATASASPTAVSASSASPSNAAGTGQASGSTLPRTGFDALLGGACGLALLAAGLAVRRQVHRSLH